MHELQESKKNLIAEVIEPGEEKLASITEEEIRDILMIYMKSYAFTCESIAFVVIIIFCFVQSKEIKCYLNYFFVPLLL